MRIKSNADGAALIEFALVLPMLMILIVGSIEAGLLFQLKNSITFHTRNIARELALGNIAQVDAPNILIARLNEYADLSYQVRVIGPAEVLSVEEGPIGRYIVTVTVPPDQLQEYSITGIVSVPNFVTTATMRDVEAD